MLPEQVWDGRYHKGPRATSFFIKADPEFHQMMKAFYDSGFSESSADDKREMSQEELRFVRELERTVFLRDSHYEMAPLPLKDREAPVPNNRPQVEQRAYWLKRKLQRNKDKYNDYKCFMADIIYNRSTNMNPFIYTSRHFTPHGKT